MWQIICLCPPAVPLSEQQRFWNVFGNATLPGGARRLDLGLLFLHMLSPQESLTVLEERLDLVTRSQELITTRQQVRRSAIDTLIDDHMHTLLAAEYTWLKRAILQLQSSFLDKSEKHN